ncbi:hypothetical protein [Leisingera sp. ANG-Vp]|uniref:hypothetical protein n=1 Tax=Leisingera sp. ANG-Vp TaxID=1577896 RepID=UPI000580015D|nr:hypothetical protein [Leisingera sp. ANG-Vp]KIC15007.1 hypothetical protein RA20_19110 [Leisingera sp. ANG-Vp]
MGAIPAEIGAGVTFRQTVSLPVYPAPEWSVSLIMRGPSQIDLAGTGEEENHALHALASATADWKPGHYRYELRASKGADVITVEAGEVRVAPNLSAQVAGYDGRGHVQRVLDAIEAVIENRATIDQQSYQINNRSLQRTPLGELMKLRDRYRAELASKKAARKGRRLGRMIKVRMK